MSKALMFIMLFTASTVFSEPLVVKPTVVNMQDILTTPILDSSCHNYCLLGVCVWLKCTLFGCSIETSIRVGHYNPDLVVSVYDAPGDNPWTEAKSLFGDLERSTANSLVGLFHDIGAGQGHRVEGGSVYTDQSLRYKEATAIGHPMASFGDFFASAGYFCPSEAESMQPYFSSGFDALTWRLGLPEMLYLPWLLPGVRVVGEMGMAQQWGPLFPRTGFILQKDEVKAAAVIAQRVGSIVTQQGQPHIYQPLHGNNYNKSWLPGELKENDRSTGIWQMVAPKQDTQCDVFGKNDVASRTWSHGRHSEDNRYVFNLWRPYKCCQQKGAFLFKVDMPAVCIP